MFRIIVDVVTAIVFVFAIGTLIIYLWDRALDETTPLTVTGFEKLQGEDAIITLSDGRRFRGSCTVWHAWPSGKRAPTSIEVICADEWTKQMWRNEQ